MTTRQRPADPVLRSAGRAGNQRSKWQTSWPLSTDNAPAGGYWHLLDSTAYGRCVSCAGRRHSQWQTRSQQKRSVGPVHTVSHGGSAISSSRSGTESAGATVWWSRPIRCRGAEPPVTRDNAAGAHTKAATSPPRRAEPVHPWSRQTELPAEFRLPTVNG